ncbi:SprT family protein [Streptococcus massiliensis]|uniref:Protein SprT-like n=1 Tax=Streptococcus massiliensis TaxID=313439 RepID=A0A380KY73_9STRE|nr:SprT family protein [Streptococcus massiliensis]SUN76219.1 SprT-like protein [Streptococcus massiliensis]
MDLTSYVQQVSREDFGKEFRHQAAWNKRLKTTGGRFFPKDRHLDFNPKIYEHFGLETFRKIVRHELCHYHLYDEQKGYRHRDKDFKDLLKQVDGLRYAPSHTPVRKSLIYQCKKCKTNYYRQRRIDTKKYRCGKCRGILERIKEK